MLNFANDLLCFVAHKPSFAPHQFQGLKLVVSIKGTFCGQLDNQHVPGLTAILVNRNTVHALSASEATLLIYYIDLLSPLYHRLLTLLNGQLWLDLSVQVSALNPEWSFVQPENTPPTRAQELLGLLFGFPDHSQGFRFDSRIQILLNYIDGHIQQPMTLSDLAPLLRLSVERTRHLFGEQLGMSFSQYLIWTRMKRVIQHVFRQRSPLGKTSVQYGFKDQSHFDRMFKRAFGTNFKALLRSNNSRMFPIQHVG
ncbi:helix-turn-helix transcriptional regulator [Spirosoma endophyticum]|uniref:helix-turn-helix transcriptional regulator n=1 Tax=Spirosoma endophyticum TaxID=662367 RepID=UPI001160B29D|nr:AraC family transcriptional regulator [Spirosoma endophyticum]